MLNEWKELNKLDRKKMGLQISKMEAYEYAKWGTDSLPNTIICQMLRCDPLGLKRFLIWKLL